MHTHIFSDVPQLNITNFSQLSLKDLSVALLFITFFVVQFSRCSFGPKSDGGDNRNRTDDPLLAKQVLSQLSYTPIDGMVGLSGLEPPTLRLSVVRSSQLSYRPILPIEGVPSKLNNVRQKRTDLRKSVGMVTNMSP